MNSCETIHEMADTFLDNELDCDESLAFSRHLNECPKLANLVASRRLLRERLRSAAAAESVSPYLTTRIQAHLNPKSKRSFWGWPAIAIAATVLIAAGLTDSWRTGGMRFTPASQQAYIDSLRPGLAPTMQIGLQQHVHCAVYRSTTSPYPTLEELARNLGSDYTDLIPAMQHGLPSGFRVISAHRCVYNERAYLHLTASDGRHLISLLVTDRASGEAFESDLRAVASEADSAIYTSTAQRFGIAGLETRDHLVYLVSDLDPDRNLSAFETMVPEIARTIRTHEI